MSQETTKSKSFVTKDYLMICASTTFLRLVMITLMTLLPVYLITLEYSKTQAGLMITVYTIAALVLRPLAGMLIDKFGRRRMLYIGTVLYIASVVPFILTKDLTIMYIAFALNGVGFSIYGVALPTMVADIVPDDKLTAGLGYYGLTATVTQALGPTIALALSTTLGYQSTFLVSALACMPVLIMYAFITYEKKMLAEKAKNGEVAEEKPVEKLPFWQKLIEKNALGPATYTFLFAIIMSAMTAFLVPYATEAGILNIGWFFTARAVGTALSRVFVGPLSKRINRKVLMGISISGIVIGTGGIYLFTNIIPLLVIAFASGLSFGMMMVLNNVKAIQDTPKHRRAAANATFYLAMDAGMGLGSTVWGVMADATGLKNIFGEAALLGVVIFIVYVIINVAKSGKNKGEAAPSQMEGESGNA